MTEVVSLNLTPDQRTKLDYIMKQGAIELDKIKQIREALNEDIKAFAEEIDVKPKHVRKAVRLAHNANFQDHQEDYDVVQTLLEATGRGESVE